MAIDIYIGTTSILKSHCCASPNMLVRIQAASNSLLAHAKFQLSCLLGLVFASGEEAQAVPASKAQANNEAEELTA